MFTEIASAITQVAIVNEIYLDLVNLLEESEKEDTESNLLNAIAIVIPRVSDWRIVRIESHRVERFCHVTEGMFQAMDQYLQESMQQQGGEEGNLELALQSGQRQLV